MENPIWMFIGLLLFGVILGPKSAFGAERDPAAREEQAVRQEARREVLAKGENPSDFEKNRYARCENHTGEDRVYCIRRMNGEGTISGSVRGGGICRELWVPLSDRERSN